MSVDWRGRCIFVDNGAPWVASLMESLSKSTPVEYIQTVSLGWLLRQGRSGATVAGGTSAMRTSLLAVPGWQRFRRMSSALLRLAIRRSVRIRGTPRAVVLTLPWYADAAAGLPGLRRVYYAYDPYRFYDWDDALVGELESRMVHACDFSLAVSQTLAGDLRKLGARTVHYFPNGTSWVPSAGVGTGKDPMVVSEQRSWTRPVVGCVGKVNYNTYDWDLLEELSGQFADCSFVFVGGLDAQGEQEKRIRTFFARPNVHWLGQRPHAALPSYLAAFDVCINPMLVSPHNNRRSPLRLFDYLTTDKPVVSSAVDETALVREHIEVASDRADFAEKMRCAIAKRVTVDVDARRRFILAQHWDMRAAELFRLLSTPGSV